MLMKTTRDLKQKMEQYVRETLLHELGYAHKTFSLEATDLGIHNHVFFLDIEGAPPLVVKWITKKERFQTLLNCTRHLLQHRVRVPGILYAREDRRFLQRPGMHIICEERITGHTVYETNAPAQLIPEIARVFSHLHSIKRNTWGKISSGDTKGLYEYLFDKTNRKLKQWEQQDCLFAGPVAKQITDRMRSGMRCIHDISSFSLSHGDPNPGNIIVSADNHLYLLDTGHLRYLPRAIDYYSLVVHFCQDNQELLQHFENNYFAPVPSGDREEFNASRLFFKLYVLVDFGKNLAGRLTTADQNHPYYKEFVTNLGKIKLAIHEVLES